MSELFLSGRIADLVLVFMAVEAVALVVYNARTGRGMRPVDILPALLAGVCLVLTLRAVMVGAEWGWVAFSLTGALAAHVVDVIRRWR